MQTAIFGGGCFWCTEAVFQQLNGVSKVISGYAGGHKLNPTYKDICNGDTGHAEVIKIEYDEIKISFEELVLIFFKTHDPTTLNRQGNDRGTQYRSVIFYLNDEQREIAEQMKQELTDQAIFNSPIVTEITEATTFYPAEPEHQNYYNNNPYQPYCSFVIEPKLNKFVKEFQEKLRRGV